MLLVPDQRVRMAVKTSKTIILEGTLEEFQRAYGDDEYDLTKLKGYAEDLIADGDYTDALERSEFTQHNLTDYDYDVEIANLCAKHPGEPEDWNVGRDQPPACFKCYMETQQGEAA